LALGLTVWPGWVYYAGMGMKVAGVYRGLLLMPVLVHARIRPAAGVAMTWAVHGFMGTPSGEQSRQYGVRLG
jgi:hypothetical protein